MRIFLQFDSVVYVRLIGSRLGRVPRREERSIVDAVDVWSSSNQAVVSRLLVLPSKLFKSFNIYYFSETLSHFSVSLTVR